MKPSQALVPHRGLAFWLVTMAACIGVLATVALGRWQLSRAAQKESLTTEMSARASEAPLAGAELAALLMPGIAAPAVAANLYRQVHLRGRWLAEKTVFLDNRQMSAKQGFFVFTPLQLEGGARPVVLVQRGWAPRNFEQRTQLPSVDTSTELVDVSGHLAGSPAQTYSLGSDQSDSGFKRIRQNLTLSAFRAETGLPLSDLTLVQQGPDAGGLSRQWTPVSNGIEKHYGYAFQWFALCALILGLYVWFQLVRPCRRA